MQRRSLVREIWNFLARQGDNEGEGIESREGLLPMGCFVAEISRKMENKREQG